MRAAGTLGARCSAQAPPECGHGPVELLQTAGRCCPRVLVESLLRLGSHRCPKPLVGFLHRFEGRVGAEPQDLVGRAPEGEHLSALGGGCRRWRWVRQEARPRPWAWLAGSWEQPGVSTRDVPECDANERSQKGKKKETVKHGVGEARDAQSTRSR